MPGLNKLMRGILHYRKWMRPAMLKEFEHIRDQPDPKAIVFSCMDSRVLITRMLITEVGDMFLVRNAGNMVPHASFGMKNVTPEPGALELGCVVNNVRNILVVGHSDCKAMNALYELRHNLTEPDSSPLHSWVKTHGAGSVSKFSELEDEYMNKALEFTIGPNKRLEAYIDPEKMFKVQDKLSQVNALQQLHNIASYPFLEKKIMNREVVLHALWFDIYSGNFYIYSPSEKRFSIIDDESYDRLMNEASPRS